MNAVRLTEEGSILIPADLRDRLGFKVGQRFEPVAQGQVILLVPEVDAAALRGSARGVPTDSYRDKER